MERLYTVDNQVAGERLKGSISVKLMTRSERLALRTQAMAGGLKGQELESKLLELMVSEFAKRVKKVNLKWGTETYKTPECLEYYDEIMAEFQQPLLDMAQGVKLEKK